MSKKSISILGYASGVAAGDHGCGDGPVVLEKSNFLTELHQAGLDVKWRNQFFPKAGVVLEVVAGLCRSLAQETYSLVRENQAFVAIGGDHSCAVGTWSGAAGAIKEKGPLGLIWIDAHMDSHTPETSESGNIHGMPTACLLGYGPKQLTEIINSQPKILPQHLCLIGIRSYEAGEAELIEKLGIKVYYMEEVHRRGIQSILEEAKIIVKQGTAGFGITIDLDGLDPLDAPGVGTPEPDGIREQALCEALATTVKGDSCLLGVEVAEYNPHHDKNAQTQQVIKNLLLSTLE